MSFHLKLGDITEMKVDAIVNSLGTNTKRYGKICRNVINGINDNDIKNYIDSLGILEPLTIVETKAGSLPCNRVIHIVTPYKKDDPDNKKLLQCYRDVIDYAIKHNIKSIAIPLIGTGSNGYAKADSWQALGFVCNEIDFDEEQTGEKIITIYKVMYLGKKGRFDESRDERLERDLELEEHNLLYGCCKTFSRVHLNESINYDLYEFYNNAKYNNEKTYDFYLYLLEKKGLNKLEVLSNYCNNEDRHYLSKVKRLSNKDIVQLAILANFTRSEVLELMAFNGSCFSPRSTLDMALLYCVNRWEKITDYIDLIEIIVERTGISIDFTSLSSVKEFEEMDKAWTTEEKRKGLLENAKNKQKY